MEALMDLICVDSIFSQFKLLSRFRRLHALLYGKHTGTEFGDCLRKGFCIMKNIHSWYYTFPTV